LGIFTIQYKRRKKYISLWNIDIGSAKIPFLIRSEPGRGGGRGEVPFIKISNTFYMRAEFFLKESSNWIRAVKVVKSVRTLKGLWHGIGTA
jgi:hypothetical protein